MNSKLQHFYQRHLLAEALCGHSLWRDIQHAAGELPGPIVFKDELRALRSQLGKSHEDQWIERLMALGVQVVEIGQTGSDEEREERTLAAMKSSAEAIHGGRISHGRWNGEPDLLMRSDVMRRLTGHTVVDEAQDISVMALRYLAAAAGATPNGLFFAGDSGQRIFQLPFSWKAQGVEVRGRSKNLRVNYRTSHQIRGHADRLLDSEVTDVDGNVETRKGTVSVFNGPDPLILVALDQAQESSYVELWIKDRLNAGYALHELGVFVRSDAQVSRATETLDRSGFAYRVLDQKVTTVSGQVSVATMHLAKGLEFRGVVVMACDDEIVPLQERLQEVGDDSDLQFTYETERHLLYVACTRARDELLVTAVAPESEFLVDLQRKP